MDMIEYSLATSMDIALLANLRIEFMVDFWGEQPPGKIRELRNELEKYFLQALKKGEYVSWLAKDGTEIAGVGGMVMRGQPGNFKNPGGKTAYIMNMYTRPA